MSNLHYYKAFGLVVASMMPIPRLDECTSQTADVEINLLPVDRPIDDSSLRNAYANWKASPGHFLLTISDVAQFYICDGKRIDIRPEAGTSSESIAAFLMGSAFAVVLQQRGILTLHASAIATEAGAVLFIGPSGVGKSTTLAAMQARGFSMVTDDVAAIKRVARKDLRIVPSFAGSKLTPRSLAQLGKRAEEYPRLAAEIEKRAIPLKLTPQKDIAIDRIILLEIWEKPQIELELLSRSEAFRCTSHFTFRKRFYDGMEMQSLHFDLCSRLAEAVPVYRLRRPDSPFLLDELVETILASLEVSDTSESLAGRS